MAKFREFEQTVQEILDNMSLKEKASIASLNEEEIHQFHNLFETLISDHLGQDDEIGKDVMHRIWEVLQ